MKIWFVGTPLYDGRWQAEAAFFTEKEACDTAKENEFVVCADVGARFPAKATDAEKMYWPKQERWEDSTLYHMRHNG